MVEVIYKDGHVELVGKYHFQDFIMKYKKRLVNTYKYVSNDLK